MSTSLTVLSPVETAACCAPLSAQPLTMEQAEQVAPLLKALADPVRLRLMSLVASRPGGEACVCDLNDAFDLSQPTISHHLKVLHEAGLVDRDKRGVWVYYRVRPQALASLGALIGCPPGLTRIGQEGGATRVGLGASEQTQRVKIVNANWVPGPDGDHGRFEVMFVTEDDQRHVAAPSPEAMTALMAMTQADTVLAWDPAGRTLIVANIVGTMPWTERAQPSPPGR